VIIEQGTYEIPESGMYIGVVVDAVELYNVPTKYGPKNKIRIVWLLDKMNSKGKPHQVIFQKNASMHEKSDLYKAVRAILGTNPPLKFNTEDLIGKVNQLMVLQEPDQNNANKTRANVKGISLPPPGAVAPKVPADYIRHKDRQAANMAQNTGTIVSTPAAAQPVPPTAAAVYTPPAPPAAQSTNATF
jgi:hypothetical protein